MQRVALERYADLHGLEMVIHKETGSSIGRRAVLEDLWKMMLAGEYDALYVWDFDRFARSLVHLVQTMEHLTALDIPFISLQNPDLNIRTPMGRAMFQIISVLAELERNLISERTRQTLQLKKEQGIRLGPPPRAMEKLPLDANLWSASIPRLAALHEVSQSSISRARRIEPWSCHKPPGKSGGVNDKVQA